MSDTAEKWELDGRFVHKRVSSHYAEFASATDAALFVRLRMERNDLLAACEALLDRLDHITTEAFSHGGERTEREALRAAVARARGETP